MSGKYGGFYFLFYKLIDKGIKNQYIMRYLYLCTFMNYSGNLLFGNAKKEIDRYMTEKDLFEVLRLSDRETVRTKKIFKENELIFIDDKGNLQINNKYCVKGTVDINYKKDGKIRIFDNAISDLYTMATPSEHKKLSLLITLLPYINLHNNIICHNPRCEFKAQLEIIDMKEICRIVRYSETQSSRLRKELLALRVGGELVVMFGETDNAKFITINPRVYYGGSVEDFKYLKHVSDDFDIKS